MFRRPPRSIPTDTRLPYTARFLSPAAGRGLHPGVQPRHHRVAGRLLPHRRDHDPAGAAAGAAVERFHLPHAAADVQKPGPQGAPQRPRVLHLRDRLLDGPAADLRLGLPLGTGGAAQELGDQVSRFASIVAACLLLAVPAANAAPPAAGGVEVFVSDDADDTSVEKPAVRAYSRYDDAEHFRGLTVDRARIRPPGDRGWTDHPERTSAV